MTKPWLQVIGLTEKGVMALPAGDLSKIAGADLVISPDRFLDDIRHLNGFSGDAMTWPQPFLDIIPLLQEQRGQKVVVCATGDPLWYGAASTLARYFSADDMEITPAASGFQWAAARMGWPQHSIRCLTVHGRPHETVLKYLAPSARLLVIAHDHQTPDQIAGLLTMAGYGEAHLTVWGISVATMKPAIKHRQKTGRIKPLTCQIFIFWPLLAQMLPLVFSH